MVTIKNLNKRSAARKRRTILDKEALDIIKGRKVDSRDENSRRRGWCYEHVRSCPEQLVLVVNLSMTKDARSR